MNLYHIELNPETKDKSKRFFWVKFLLFILYMKMKKKLFSMRQSFKRNSFCNRNREKRANNRLNESEQSKNWLNLLVCLDCEIGITNDTMLIVFWC